MIRVGAAYTLELHELLGEGWFGEVFKTSLVGMPGNYATKFFPKSQVDPGKYFDEAAKLHTARNPNVVNFVWTAECQDPGATHLGDHSHIQIVMEFYPGGSVDKAIPPLGMSNSSARHVIIETVKGLACCHSRDILHLDIKPNNLLVRSDGGVVLSDFGQALSVSPATGVASGVDHELYKYHQPPETVLSPQSDFWQLGLTYYRLLTAASKRDIWGMRGPDPRGLRDRLIRPIHCSNKTWNLIRKMLADKPEERPKDSVEILHALSNCDDLSDWRLAEATPTNWAWESPATEEVVRVWTSNSNTWEVECKKKNRRVLSICPKARPTTRDEAWKKVDQCFRALEKA